MSKFKNIERNLLEIGNLLSPDNRMVPPPVVINLDKDKDRHRDIDKHLSELKIRYSRLAALNGVTLPATGLTVGETSCSLSHAAAVRYMILADNQRYVNCKAWLILEDDCRFLVNPRMALAWILANVPPDWSIVSLGSYNKDRPDLKDGQYRLHTKFSWVPYGSHAYLVNPTHAHRILGLFSSCTAPVDHILHSEFASGKGYLIRPSISYQELYPSNVADWGVRKSVKHHADLHEDDLKILREENE